MYAAFNTLQLELERLLLLQQSIEQSGQAAQESYKLLRLSIKIRSHERAIKLINAAHQQEQRTQTESVGAVIIN